MEFEMLLDDDGEFFYHLFTQAIIDSEDWSTSHIEIPRGVFGNYGEQQVLIIRDAYNKILPYVEARWGQSITVVTGTPGIGKTYLGAWHLRLLILDALVSHQERIIAYYINTRVYAFTWDKELKTSFDMKHELLQSMSGEKKLWCGVSANEDTAHTVRKLVRQKKCYMIADPQDDDKSLAHNVAMNGNLVVYASHGHSVLKEFARKRPVLDDHNTFVLPGWPEQELRTHLKLLRVSGGDNRSIPEMEVQERIFVAGKMVRYFVAPDISGVRAMIDSTTDKVVLSKRWKLMEDGFSPHFWGPLVSLDIFGYEYSISNQEQSDEVGHSKAPETGSGSTNGWEIIAASEDEGTGKTEVGSNASEGEKQGVQSNATNQDTSSKHQSACAEGQIGNEGGRTDTKRSKEDFQDQAGNADESTNENYWQTSRGGGAVAANPFSRDKAEKTHVSAYVIQQLEVKLKAFTTT